MVKLFVVSIIDIIKVHPEGVIVGVNVWNKQGQHAPSEPTGAVQVEESLECLVGEEDTAQRQQPYDQHLKGGIKVEVFVRSFTKFLIGSWNKLRYWKQSEQRKSSLSLSLSFSLCLSLSLSLSLKWIIVLIIC